MLPNTLQLLTTRIAEVERELERVWRTECRRLPHGGEDKRDWAYKLQQTKLLKQHLDTLRWEMHIIESL